MRVNTWRIAAVFSVAVLLTGCSAPGTDLGPETKPSTGGSSETAAPTTGCPELQVGTTVSGETVSTCAADALMRSTGYAMEGEFEFVEWSLRANPPEREYEMLSQVFSATSIGDVGWTQKMGGAWKLADPSSSDPEIAEFAKSLKAGTWDPNPAPKPDATTEYTVHATDERLGQKVYVLDGTTEEDGAEVEVRFEITADYAMLAMHGVASVDGQSAEVSMEVTEWDVKQDIVPPL